MRSNVKHTFNESNCDLLIPIILPFVEFVEFCQNSIANVHSLRAFSCGIIGLNSLKIVFFRSNAREFLNVQGLLPAAFKIIQFHSNARI